MSLRVALLERYPSIKGWALFFEVADGTSLAKTRSADAVAIGLWQSNGFARIGFEFKASRSDWLKELRDPAKAQAIGRYCHEWWLVTESPGLAKPDELPLGWGFMELVDGGLKIKTKPKRRDAENISPAFFSALARAACESTQMDRIKRDIEWATEKRVKAAVEKQLADAKETATGMRDALAKANKLQSELDMIERLTGMTAADFRRHNYTRNFPAIFKAALDCDERGVALLKRELETNKRHLRQQLEQVEKMLEDVAKEPVDDPRPWHEQVVEQPQAEPDE